MTSGIAIWVDGKDIEHCIETAVKMWIKECPIEVKLTKEHIKKRKDSLHNKNGMSKDGNIKELLEIPRGLHKRLSLMLESDSWYQDKKLRDKFMALCPGLLTYERTIK